MDIHFLSCPVGRLVVPSTDACKCPAAVGDFARQLERFRRLRLNDAPPALLLYGRNAGDTGALVPALAAESRRPVLFTSMIGELSPVDELSFEKMCGFFEHADEVASDMGACIVHIDDIDVLGARSPRHMTTDSGDAMFRFLIRKLTEPQSGSQLAIVLATKHRDALDPVLLSRMRYQIEL